MSEGLKKNKKTTHEGPDSSSPYPVSRLAPPIDLVDLAMEIQQADKMVNVRVSSKLQVIADQIQALQQEAREALQEAQKDQELHRAQCGFKRIPGKIYHLYEKDDGSRYFSMLSPKDWRGKQPHTFIGSFQLEADMSWTPEAKINQPNDTRRLVKKLLEDE